MEENALESQQGILNNYYDSVKADRYMYSLYNVYTVDKEHGLWTFEDSNLPTYISEVLSEVKSFKDLDRYAYIEDKKLFFN